MKQTFICLIEANDPLFIQSDSIKAIFLFLMKYYGYNKKILLKAFGSIETTKDCIELFEAITDEHIIYLDTIKGNLYLDETHTWYVNVNENGDEI